MPDQHRSAPPLRLAINFSQGAKWKALISKYIVAIPVNGDAFGAAARRDAAARRPFDQLRADTLTPSISTRRVFPNCAREKRSEVASGRSYRPLPSREKPSRRRRRALGSHHNVTTADPCDMPGNDYLAAQRQSAVAPQTLFVQRVPQSRRTEEVSCVHRSKYL